MPPHDPLAEELGDEARGTIGGYDIIKTATTFADIGGNAAAKDFLTEIAYQFKDPELYAKWDVPVPKGVLLYGKPGTGKTMLAKAFAAEADADFVEVPVAGLCDKYYGESEKRLKTLFGEAARHKRRVIVFFDEIDALLPDRSGMPPTHPDVLLVNAFLQATDGMRSAANIMILGATNHPEKLDKAAIRPGRIDRKVEVAYPDKAACGDIAARQLLKAERSAQRMLVADELDVAEIGRYMEGLSGADIAEVLNRAKRTMVQTERTMGAAGEIAGIEPLNFDAERNTLALTTDDIIAAAISYRLGG